MNIVFGSVKTDILRVEKSNRAEVCHHVVAKSGKGKRKDEAEESKCIP